MNINEKQKSVVKVTSMDSKELLEKDSTPKTVKFKNEEIYSHDEYEIIKPILDECDCAIVDHTGKGDPCVFGIDRYLISLKFDFDLELKKLVERNNLVNATINKLIAKRESGSKKIDYR